MKITIKVLWYIIVSAMVLTMFVLVSAKVLAHDEGQCLADVDGNVFRSNDGWVKVIEHLRDADLKEFVHGHRHQYYDRHGNPTGQTTNFWSIYVVADDSDYLADCPTTTVDRPTTTPIRQSVGATHLVDFFVDPPTPTQPRQSSPPSTSSTSRSTPTKPITDEIAECESVCDDADRVPHTFQLHKGLNLFHFSVIDSGVCDVGDVYDRLRQLVGRKIISEFQYFDGEWIDYDRDGDTIELTTYTAFKFRMTESKKVSLWACPLEHDATIEFREGLNPMAFPESIDGYVRLNDLLAHPAIDSVQFSRKGGFMNRKKIGQHDDVVEIAPFRAYIITASQDFVFKGNTPAAPSAQRQGTLATSWGAMKERQ